MISFLAKLRQRLGSLTVNRCKSIRIVKDGEVVFEARGFSGRATAELLRKWREGQNP
jgi:hypothetical protein